MQSKLGSIIVGRSALFSSSKPYYKVSFLLIVLILALLLRTRYNNN
jgi:hypothetical protein